MSSFSYVSSPIHLYLSPSLTLQIRCAFRVAEYSEGYSGKLRTTEWYIYTFDTLSLFVGIAIWAIVWPPRYLDAADDKTVKGTTLGSEEMMVRNPGGHEVQQKY